MANRVTPRVRGIAALGGGFYHALRDRQFRLLFGLTCTVITGGAVFYHFVEGWAWIDAFYFATVTIATVGYGDFVPVTDAGKLFTMAYVVVGVGLFVSAGASLADHVICYAREARARREEPSQTGSRSGSGSQDAP